MSTQQPRTLLLVEDEALFRRLIVKHLTRQGHEVIETADAESALRAYYLQQFDAVITDVHLPGMSGLELGLAMRDIRPDQPIVFVTGDVDEKLANEALAQGGAGYLLKPFEFFELDAAIRQAIEARPGSAPPAPRASPALPELSGADDAWRLEQQRLLEAAARKPIDLRVRNTPREPTRSAGGTALLIIVAVSLMLLAAWGIGYWISSDAQRADQVRDQPGIHDPIYVPPPPPRPRERPPDRR